MYTLYDGIGKGFAKKTITEFVKRRKRKSENKSISPQTHDCSTSKEHRVLP